MSISSMSRTREVLWFKKLEINQLENGLQKTKSALGESKVYNIVERVDEEVCVTISENFLRKCQISMTKDTVDVFSPAELDIWYDFTVYATDPATYTGSTPASVTEAISRDLYSIYIEEPIEKCGKNTRVIEERSANIYGDEDDERIYFTS